MALVTVNINNAPRARVFWDGVEKIAVLVNGVLTATFDSGKIKLHVLHIRVTGQRGINWTGTATCGAVSMDPAPSGTIQASGESTFDGGMLC